MKIQKQSNKSKKRIIITIIIAIIVIGVLYGGTAKAMSWWPFKVQTTQNVAAETNDSKTDGKTNSPSKPSEKPVDTPKTPSKDGEYSEEPTKEEKGAALRITSLNQSGGNVTVVAAVNGATAGGRCIVYFTSDPEGSAVSKYMTTTKNDSEIACSISIDELEFSYLGTWNARVVYTTPSNTKVQSTGSLEIR